MLASPSKNRTISINAMNRTPSPSFFPQPLLPALALSGALLATACGPSLPIRVPSFPGGSTGANLQQVMGVRQNVGLIAVKPEQRFSKRFRFEDWGPTVETRVRQKINEFGYYNLIDIESRRAQLTELARSQSGTSSNQLAIGRQLSADGLLFITMTREPRFGSCIPMRDNHNNLFGYSQEVTVYVSGRLVNTETGRSLTYTNTKPIKHQYDADGCGNYLSALDKAMDDAAGNVASALSPRVLTHRVNLSDDPGALGDENEEKRIRDQLRSGIDWAKQDNFEEAEREWQDALSASGRRSPGALWNLAVLAWRRGQMSEAEDYFRRFLRLQPNDSSSRKKYSMFRSHQKLLQKRAMEN